MKFRALVFLTLICNSVFAQVSGNGCNIGGQVAMEYLGTAPYYGGPKVVQVYRSANYVPILNENGYSGYNCSVINIYSAGKRYNPATNSDVSYPAENDIVSTGTDNKGCVVAPSLNSTPVGEGPIVVYSYKKPQYCGGTTPSNVPLDDLIPHFIILIGGFGFYFIRSKLKPANLG